MPRNIKDNNVHKQARKLATLMGTSITQAVRDAIADKLKQLEFGKSSLHRQRTADAILARGRACAAHIAKGAQSADHDQL